MYSFRKDPVKLSKTTCVILGRPLLIYCCTNEVSNFSIDCWHTVEPLNKGHFGAEVLSSFWRLSSGGRFKPIGHL